MKLLSGSRIPLIALLVATAGLACSVPQVAVAQTPPKKNKYRDFNDVTEGAKTYDGLFKLYQVDEHVYAELRSSQLNKMYLAPIAIASGIASAGTPLNFGDEWILSFRRAGDRILLVRNNIHYEAPKGTPLARAVDQNFNDSILMALPIVSVNPRTQGVLIDFSSIFLTDFAGLGLGPMDRSRSSWHKIKAFENNIEMQVEATFRSSSSAGGSMSDDGVVDPRGVTVVIHYSLANRPSSGYQPRLADQRVGHFISATKDFGKTSDSKYVRRINRWRLEKANPRAKLSPPKKQLVWWVENNVPHEYRPYVEEGILEWNKAFEKIGFRNAIGVRWQNERDEFDPEDINYCTFRWITTSSTFAMSGLRADPITGEMIDGDVIFDASWIDYWKRDYALMVGAPLPTGQDASMDVLGVGEIISPIMANKFAFGLPLSQQARRAMLQSHGYRLDELDTMLIPAGRGVINLQLNQRLANARFSSCRCASARRHEYAMAAMALFAAAEKEEAKSDEEEDDKDAEEDGDEENGDEDDDDKEDKDEKKSKELKLPEELIGQAIKEVVMHEVGHSLGLRHNFKASAMLSLDEINNPEITREKGMAGSVMDYNPLNISRPGEEQGDYASTTIGPYDYWAIEYAYKPISGNEAAELKKIASRSPEPDLIYATDEDMYGSHDPLVNTYDLGNDNLRYAKDRIELTKELLKGLDEKVVRDGESWARLRTAFSVLLSQYGNSAHLASNYIGGQSISRDFKGTDESRDPIVPIAGEKQREALDFLLKEILVDEPFDFSPQVLRRLALEHWYHWGSDSMGSSSEFNVYSRILAIQRIALSHCLNAAVMQRLQNHELMVDEDAKPMKISELIKTVTDHIWSDLEDEPSLVKRNLQTEHLNRMIAIVAGPQSSTSSAVFVLMRSSGSYPNEARSLARMHLVKLAKRLQSVVDNGDLNDTTQAHYEAALARITKVLNAQITVSP